MIFFVEIFFLVSEFGDFAVQFFLFKFEFCLFLSLFLFEFFFLG